MSVEMWLGVGAMVISLGTLLLGIYRGKHEARNLEAQATEAFANAAKSMAEEIRQLKKEIAELQITVNDYKLYTDALVSQMRDAGLTPVTMEEVLSKGYRRKR